MRVVIARQSGELRDQLRQAVLGLGLECKASDCVAYDEMVDRLGKGPVGLVLVGLGSDPDNGLRAVALAAAATSATVLAVSVANDSALAAQALRHGARALLREDEIREELLAALRTLHSAGVAAPRWGKVLAVTGAQGGLGVTTVATNLAFALAERYTNKVVLAEFGDGVPQLALNLDLNPPHGLDALASALDRLDGSMLRQALVPHPAGLSVLANQPEVLDRMPLLPVAVRNILILLRGMFDYTVLDLGHVLDPACQEALTLADKVAVVLRLDVPTLRLSRQFLRQLGDLGIARDKIEIVVNRFGQRQQFPWRKAQQSLGVSVAEWIPDDPARINKAVNHGRPLVLVARGAPITRRFATLAHHLYRKSA
jgi:pilus assembly protein CpaE